MKRILIFATFALVLLSSCGKENDLEPKGDFLDDLLGLYVGTAVEVTSEDQVTRDANGNIIGTMNIQTDTTYDSTVDFIREQADSTFSFVTGGQTLGPFKWNEDNVYSFINERQGIDYTISYFHDAVAESLELNIIHNQSEDVVGQPTINKKYRFNGTLK